MIDRDIASLPAVVQITAHTHITLLDRLLPGWLIGWYAVGSAALGCFDGRFSDLDFVAVVRGMPAADGQAALERVHRRLSDRRLFAALDGFYVPEGAFSDNAAPCLRFNDGRFQPPAAFSPHSPDGWMLKRRGVPFYGPEPGGLPYEPDWELIRRGMARNLDTYWRKWADDSRKPGNPRSLGLLLSPAALEWAVLGVSRLYYSLRENDIAGKTEAGEYALSSLPDRWGPILREALRRRDRGIARQYAWPQRRRRDALAYLDYVIGEWGQSGSAASAGCDTMVGR